VVPFILLDPLTHDPGNGQKRCKLLPCGRCSTGTDWHPQFLRALCADSHWHLGELPGLQSNLSWVKRRRRRPAKRLWSRVGTACNWWSRGKNTPGAVISHDIFASHFNSSLHKIHHNPLPDRAGSASRGQAKIYRSHKQDSA